MQYPAANAHPFEFARVVLLMAAVAFCVGFGGYVALHPGPTHAAATLAREAAQPAPAKSQATVVSTPIDDSAERPEKT